MLRDNLLGLGLLAGAGGFGGLGLAGMHTTVGGPHESTIAARSTLPSHTLAGGLFTGLTLQLLELGTQGSNFSEEGLHLGKLRKWWEGVKFFQKRLEGVFVIKTNGGGGLRK
jgi:hypothetical protein